MSQSNDQALRAFISNVGEIQVQLSVLTGYAENHMDTLPEDIHWGHVGSTRRVLELLDQIHSFLNLD